MRIQKKFGERTLYFKVPPEERPKYILVYEGEETEVQYFLGVIDNREYLKINPIIDLMPILRSSLQHSYSHPIKIIELLDEHLEKYNTVKVMIDKIVDFSIEHIGIDENSIYNPISLKRDIEDFVYNTYDLKDYDQIEVTKELLENIGRNLERKIDILNQIEMLEKYIQDQQITFDKEIDFVCLIIDRDKGNIKPKQYDDIINKCKEKDISLYVTNPTFEFWLLLHSDEIYNIDRKEIYENKKIGKKRFLETKLSSIFDGYKKANIKFEKFKPNIKMAIEREKEFCEDVVKLEDEIGCNIGLLLKKMME